MFDWDQRERLLSQLLFAGDMALVTESAECLQCLITKFGRVRDIRTLRLYVENSKVMAMDGEASVFFFEV